jgi:hypothetical protein
MMNLYGCLLVEQFQIWNVSQFSQKVMLTIVYGPTGFAVVTALGSGCKFNAGYYVSTVLTPLSEWWRERGGGNFGN